MRKCMTAWVGLVLLGLLPSASAGPSAETAALIKALKDENRLVRLRAMRDLGNQGAAARDAAPTLGLLLRADTEPEVLTQAARALAQIGPAGVPELLKALRDPELRVRYQAAGALGIIGPDAREAVPLLTAALKETNDKMRARALYALGEIGPEARPAVPALVRTLRDREPDVRTQASGALRQIGPAAVPALEEALRDAD